MIVDSVVTISNSLRPAAAAAATIVIGETALQFNCSQRQHIGCKDPHLHAMHCKVTGLSIQQHLRTCHNVTPVC